MAVLLLKLAGPLQSWGSNSRFTERKTQHEPTKSGVIGLVAAALGRRRKDPVNDLVSLRFGVRIDQPGTYERDFQTEHTRTWDKEAKCWVFKDSLPLSHRFYLSDAIFIAAFEGDSNLVHTCAEALEHPVFPLFLGRRSCPPSCKVLLGIEEHATLLETLSSVPWQATDSYRHRWNIREKEEIKLEILYDKGFDDYGEGYDVVQQDVPVAFSQTYRQYSWRTVSHATTTVKNPSYKPQRIEHDPLVTIDEVMS
ncbi:type I-E CRISPR-associated protein Cas5/CasD [Lancefieldella sp. Marseille-Q7238]|uniref:type I-E CRISPR-associated protein Cas5/CasD n=1 Tax=Lancefieldella sp. Marseille-Q7238 TaxID=3022127 RepID=UPI0024A81900|nr:type I-E CRISPR-associated protein Cas5/CasD [Lancefieldella sp. Marseille-Q7238]